MPSSLQARMTRTAISPRLAIRILLKSAKSYEFNHVGRGVHEVQVVGGQVCQCRAPLIGGARLRQGYVEVSPKLDGIQPSAGGEKSRFRTSRMAHVYLPCYLRRRRQEVSLHRDFTDFADRAASKDGSTDGRRC